MNITLTSFLLLATPLLIQGMQQQTGSIRRSNQKPPLLRLGSLSRLWNNTITSDSNPDSPKSPKTPKTPHSQLSSATPSPDQSPQTPRMSPRPQQFSDRTLARQVKKEEEEKKKYETLINDIRTCIFNGDAKGLAKFVKKVKAFTPRPFQFISQATGVPNIQKLLLCLLSNIKEDHREACKKFSDRYGTTPLHEAASLNNSEALLGFACMLGVLEPDSPINSLTDSQQRPPLFDAASATIAQQLIEWGAKVNAQDNKGNTFFHYCCADGKGEIIKVLLENRADINQKNSDGQTPFLYRVPSNRDAFTLMIGNPHIQLMDCDKKGHNALHRLILSKASPEDKVHFARILKRMGVDMYQPDNDQNLPHHIWASYGIIPGSQELIKFAVEECNIDMLVRNKAFQDALDLILRIPACHSTNGPLGEPIKRQLSTPTAIKIEADRLSSLTQYIEDIATLQWAKHEAEAKENADKALAQLNNNQEPDDLSSEILSMMTLNISDVESI